MTLDILDRAAEAMEGTTPGPWETACDLDSVYVQRAEKNTNGLHVMVYTQDCNYEDEHDAETEANARFIAASRQLVPDMAEEIATMRRTLDMIASGQVDAVALARAEKRRWGEK